MIKTSLNNRRFRAAYDFLLLRTQVHEVDEEIGEWWTKIQEVDPAEREEMIIELGEVYKRERQPKRQQSKEPDGNSIDYNAVNYNGNQVGVYDDGFGSGYGHNAGGNDSARQNRNQNGGRKKVTKRGGKRAAGAQNNRGRNQRRNANTQGGQGTQQTGSAAPKQNRGQQRRRTKAGGQNRGRRNGPAKHQDARYVEARPKDDYGNYSSDSASTKKVKVRRKRRVTAPDGENPIF